VNKLQAQKHRCWP